MSFSRFDFNCLKLILWSLTDNSTLVSKAYFFLGFILTNLITRSTNKEDGCFFKNGCWWFVMWLIKSFSILAFNHQSHLLWMDLVVWQNHWRNTKCLYLTSLYSKVRSPPYYCAIPLDPLLPFVTFLLANENILLLVLESGRNSIKRALDFISQKSCLKFKVKDGNDRDWIRFIDKGRYDIW